MPCIEVTSPGEVVNKKNDDCCSFEIIDTGLAVFNAGPVFVGDSLDDDDSLSCVACANS